jgi:hypothetical protein
MTQETNDNVFYSGNGTVGRENTTAPTGYFFQMPKRESVHAIDISQERVDETAKSEHEFFCPRCGHCCREWVGLTHEERDEIDQNCRSQMEALFAIEAKLKEKNSG